MTLPASIHDRGRGKASDDERTRMRRAVRAGRRGGFTLLELLLVLAVLVIVAAISWPALESWFQGHHLQQGLDTVREHWIKARTLAMEEGRPYRFGCVFNAGVYRLAPDYYEHWPEFEGVAAGPQESALNQPEGTIIEEQLPQGVVFHDWEGLQPSIGLNSSAWSNESIVFWPDGTARLVGADGLERSETMIVLRDGAGQMRGLHLRAITGVVSVQRTVP